MTSPEVAAPSPVGIVGGGSWGTALSHLIGSNGHDVLHWMRDAGTVDEVNATRVNTRYLPGMVLPARVRATTSLEAVGTGCRLILLVVPSGSLRGVVAELGAHLDGAHQVVHAVKGFEGSTLKRMSEVVREETCVRQIGVLSGPNLAREVAEGQPSATVVASHFPAVIDAARAVLAGPTFRVYGNTDVVGAEVGGAVKNIMAIAAGIATGLSFGDNTRALLLTRGLAEVARLGHHLGARQETFSGLSGIGDLMATCFSPLSRNFQVGLRLARGESLAAIVGEMRQVAEGVKTARTVHEYATAEGVHMPITEGVYQIVHGGVEPREVLAGLMNITRYTYEQDPSSSGE
ncbi:MAG: NAD(P)H-dependent glycerol-3-phosphate dehydrogenase [Candidatus Sericytochromatia bacterium]|nr:NAD(P)H-dependent glycerol-3-phosphate dehydrogenase [Candidatus Sericytochromatia bacterium]